MADSSVLGLQTYLLKLARSGEDGEKIYLVLESGTRFHTTKVRPPGEEAATPAELLRANTHDFA